MDPVSFAASLIAISGVVSASCKIVYRYRDALKNAPKDVERLSDQLTAFEGLLQGLNTHLQDHPNFGPSQETLRDLLNTSMKLMQRDVDSLHGVLTKLQRSIDKKPRLAVRAVLSEKQIAKYQQSLVFHCETLTNIQAIICGRKLDALQQDTDQSREQIDAACRTLSSHLLQSTERLSLDIQSGFSNSLSQLTRIDLANQARHHDVIARFDSQAHSEEITFEKLGEITREQLRAREVSEAGFQAIHSGIIAAATSDQESHKSTHDSLHEQKDLLQQIIRHQITLRPTRLEAGTSRGLSTSRMKSKMVMDIFWGFYSYKMPVGKMSLRVLHTLQDEDSRSLTAPRLDEATITIEFVPPRWLPQAVIQYSITLGHTLNKFYGFRWHSDVNLNCMTINNDPSFIEAVRNADIRGLRNAFEQGLARPTDYIVDDKVLAYPWYNIYDMHPDRKSYVLDLFPMFEFLVSFGLPEQGAELLQQIGYRLDDVPIRSYLNKNVGLYSRHLHAVNNFFDQSGLTIPDAIRLMMHGGSNFLEWVPSIIMRSQEPLMIEELEPVAVCLISLVAHENRSFRVWLQHEMASYRSPCGLHHDILPGTLFESTFGSASLIQHFAALDSNAKSILLMAMARHGSRPTFELLPIHAVRDCARSVTAEAAVRGRIDIVQWLIEAGASSNFVLLHFLLYYSSIDYLPDDVFKRILMILLDHVRPPPAKDSTDILDAVIRSRKALRLYPEALKILLDRKVYRVCKGGLPGMVPVEPLTIHGSHIYEAILSDLPSAVELLLQHGAALEHRDPNLISSSHLISAVLHGRASCADVLIRHGADVTSRDTTGTSAVQAAKTTAVMSAPRQSSLKSHRRHRRYEWLYAEADAEVLAVVKRAFDIKYRGTRNFEDDTDFEQSPPYAPQERPSQKYLGFLKRFLTPHESRFVKQTLKYVAPGLHQPWRTILRDLVLRFFYVLSYIIVVIVEGHALFKRRKRFPIPSRQILSAFIVVLLAIMNGSSWLGLESSLWTDGQRAAKS